MSRLLGADTSKIVAKSAAHLNDLIRIDEISQRAVLDGLIFSSFKLDLMRIDTNKFDSVTRSLMPKLVVYLMKQYTQCFQTFTSKFINFLILRKAMHFRKPFFSSRYQTGQCGTLLDTDLYRIPGLVFIDI